MALSTRAQAYLATLKRIPAVPVREVEAALERTGFPVYPAWLEFHEQYAGYVEPLGLESAVLGIVHRDSYWIPPNEAAVETWDDGEHVVTCAEVHPSFSYILFEDGHFWSSGGAGECVRYDIKIEQCALLREAREAASTEGPWGRLTRNLAGDPSALERIREALAGEHVDEASDTYNDAWRAPNATWLAGRANATGRALVVWAPEAALARIARIVDGT